MYLCSISGQKILLNVPCWAFNESVVSKNITFIGISGLKFFKVHQVRFRYIVDFKAMPATSDCVPIFLFPAKTATHKVVSITEAPLCWICGFQSSYISHIYMLYLCSKVWRQTSVLLHVWFVSWPKQDKIVYGKKLISEPTLKCWK